MMLLNRQTRYEIIKRLISMANPELIKELASSFGFVDESNEDIEERRKQLLDYLDEMHIYWNDNNIDLIDKQYIEIIEDPEAIKRVKASKNLL